jgi:hypothetical protein
MALSDYEERIIANVDEHGWYCISVFGDEDGPGFSYSIGFMETLGAPEFIVFGFESKLAHRVLWEVFRQIQKGATEPFEGRRWSGLIEGYDCISRRVHSTQHVRDYFNSALWHRRHCVGSDAEFQAYQLFWPGAVQGLFPWESDCEQIVRDHQPALYLPRTVGIA